MQNDIPRWAGNQVDTLDLIGTTNLFYNGAVFVRNGLGNLLTFEGLINTSASAGLTFIPLAPQLTTKMYIVWKKYQSFTPIADHFIDKLHAELIS